MAMGDCPRERSGNWELSPWVIPLGDVRGLSPWTLGRTLGDCPRGRFHGCKNKWTLVDKRTDTLTRQP